MAKKAADNGRVAPPGRPDGSANRPYQKHSLAHQMGEESRVRAVRLPSSTPASFIAGSEPGWHASHYVKVMLDQILGENNFMMRSSGNVLDLRRTN
jgi:hypothetical protein